MAPPASATASSTARALSMAPSGASRPSLPFTESMMKPPHHRRVTELRLNRGGSLSFLRDEPVPMGRSRTCDRDAGGRVAPAADPGRDRADPHPGAAPDPRGARAPHFGDLGRDAARDAAGRDAQ